MRITATITLGDISVHMEAVADHPHQDAEIKWSGDVERLAEAAGQPLLQGGIMAALVPTHVENIGAHTGATYEIQYTGQWPDEDDVTL